MPIYIYKGNSQISTNAVRNDKAVKAIYAKEQREEAVCVWGTNLNILPFTYTKNETSITITGLKSGVMMKHLRVPETIEDLPVTQITYDTFKNNTVLESIRLPNSLNSIGNSAFYGCKGLTSITIPDGVTSIGGSAFRGCTGLTSVTIPDSVTSIGVRIFYNCSGLTSITFNGTTTQWNAISKGNQWNYNTGNYTIHCTDGDIPK